MKILALLALVFFVIACDPYGFGFKKNPTYVLDQALKAIQNMDHESFLEISGKEALCLYGNKDGITYLHDQVTADVQNLQLKHKEIGKLKVLGAPEYVGFWSYLRQRYVVEIQHKSDRTLLGTLVVDCNYGASGEKKSSYLNIRDPKKFSMKECRMTKIIPASFKPIQVTPRCKNLIVTL
jgi:hypothetical protein